MRKKVILLWLVMLLLGTPVSVAASGITVVVNGARVEFEHGPVLRNGRMLVSVRELFTAMGALVSWDDATRTVTAKRGDVEVGIPLGTFLPTVGHMPVAIDAPAMLIEERIYVPLRFAVTSLGAGVRWATAENTAFITTAATAAAGAKQDGGVSCAGRLDINTAGLEDLLAIEGLGEAAAAEIIAWRETNGAYRSLGDLKKLPCMTDALCELILPRIQIIYREEGTACWYGSKFHGRMTSSGEVYDQSLHTAAHRTLPFGAMVKVTFLQTGQSVWVRINDRGPHVAGRIIDLSRAAADAIGLTSHGLGLVALEVVMLHPTCDR